jgi:hypothetical protein
MSEMPIEELLRYVAYLAAACAILGIIDIIRGWFRK